MRGVSGNSAHQLGEEFLSAPGFRGSHLWSLVFLRLWGSSTFWRGLGDGAGAYPTVAEKQRDRDGSSVPKFLPVAQSRNITSFNSAPTTEIPNPS